LTDIASILASYRSGQISEADMVEICRDLPEVEAVLKETSIAEDGKMSRYAANTSVSVGTSKAEIERIVERYGADGFMSAWHGEKAVIAFAMDNRQIRFVLDMPPKTERRFTHHSRGTRTPDAALKEWEQACRQRWRALALVIKAKLEAVESGISVFEDEFLANIVMPDGQTVSQHTRPLIAAAYDNGAMPPLSPDYSGGRDA